MRHFKNVTCKGVSLLLAFFIAFGVSGAKALADAVSGAINIGTIQVAKIYQAENAILLGGASVATDHTGYLGTGFVAGFGAKGDGVTFTASEKTAGSYTLDIRYSLGAGDSGAQSLDMSVNGAADQTISFGDLGSWNKWWDLKETVSLNAGSNTITIYDDGDNGYINLDYITLRPSRRVTPGAVTGYEGNGTSQLTFHCDNADVEIKEVASGILKVWCDPTRSFSRKYDSFAVVNDSLSPGDMAVSQDADGDYEFGTGSVKVKVTANPFGITYMDESGTILCQSAPDSFSWDADGEISINNQLSDGENFWGLGEKAESFNKTGTQETEWSTDYLGSWGDAYRAQSGQGLWYTANPYFISSKGYSVYFDNTTRTCFDMGVTSPSQYSFGTRNPAAGGDMVYYFMYGPGMKQLTKNFTDLVGKSFLAPEWALGNMQCHYGYTQADIERVAAKYRSENIPCDALMSDIDWYQNYCDPGGSGYSAWNSTKYPDPQSMLSTLQSQNFKYMLIADPNIASSTTTTDYTDGDKNGYFMKGQNGKTETVNWPWGGASGLVDFSNPNAANWFGNLLQNIVSQGVSGFWLDMNEPARYNVDWLAYNKAGKSYGNINEFHNAYALAEQKAIYGTLDSSNNGTRPFLLTRSGFTGTQRYAAPWTGDTSSHFADTEQQMRLGLGLSLSGYDYWGYDIGGFHGAFTDSEYDRAVEMATLFPVHRFHYSCSADDTGSNTDAYTSSATSGKEPWNFGDVTENLSRNSIDLRYQLIPYMYSCLADSVVGTGLETVTGAGGTGIPLDRPMVMEFQDDTNTYNLDDQFMCGPDILEAPVVDNSTTKSVYLPKNTVWYDYNDGKTIYTAGDSGTTFSYPAPLDTVPLFVKAGAIIPTNPVMQYVGQTPVTQLTMDVYPLTGAGSSSFVLYEDDGATDSYKSGDYATTKYTCTTNDDTRSSMTFQIDAKSGSYTNKDRGSYLLQFHDVNYANPTITDSSGTLTSYDSLDALKAATSGYYQDAASGICYVEVPDGGDADTVTLSGAQNFTVPTEKTAISVLNGGFEDGDLTGWTTWGDNKDFGIDGNDVYDGNDKCYFYNSSAYQASIHQTLTGLTNGTYQVSAYVKVSNNDPQTAQMEIGQYDTSDPSNQAESTVATPQSNGYVQYTQTVTVNTNTLSVGFYCNSNASGGTSMQIDDVTVTKVG